MDGGADVFISYSRRDRDAASSLSMALRDSGFSVWIDSVGIGAATRWSAEIAHALEQCRAVIVLLSAESILSKNVLKELTLAAESDKLIIPVEIERVELPTTFKYHLAGLQRTKLANVEAITAALRMTLPQASAQVSITIPPASTTPRIAVVPFEDQSAAHDNEWFSDGLTDELISTLGRIEGLFVVDKQTSREFKHSRLAAKQIAAQLAVRYIVMGAVRKHEKQIRISCTLVDAHTGSTLWDEKYPGTMDDIFEIQDRVASQIAHGLQLVLTPEEQTKIEQKPTQNPKAYELLLRGNDALSRNTKDEYLHAIELYERCIALDPMCADAYGGLVSALTGMYSFYERSVVWLDRTQKVIASMESRSIRGVLALVSKASLAALREERDQAKAFAEEALGSEIDSFPMYMRLAETFAALHEPARAAEMWQQALRFSPEHHALLFNLMTTYGQHLNDPVNARRIADRLLPIASLRADRFPEDAIQQVVYAIALQYAGKAEEWGTRIRLATEQESIDGLGLWMAAASYARAGDVQATIMTLQRTFRLLKMDPAHVLSEHSFDNVRTNPRFEEYVKNLLQ